jgi:molybdopterin synthase catalytic subunit
MTEPIKSNTSVLDESTRAVSAPGIGEAAQGTKPELTIAAGFEVRVQRQQIEIESEMAPLMRNPKVGAVVNFLGIVRQFGDEDEVSALEIEHYPGMTEQALWSIVEEAIARWDLQAVKIIHRIGRVALGNPVVLIVVASEHRAAAFTACEFLMDFLKCHAPFWKKEIGRDGVSRWVGAKDRDEREMKRWG